MYSTNQVALALILLGAVLTTLSFYRLQAIRNEPKAPPVLTVDSFQGWVPPMQPPAEQSAEQPQPVSTSPIVRVSAPRVGINAPVEVLTLDRAGAMEDPRTPNTVAWYDFSARPGQLGNVVFAGHVDYEHYGPAVFWRLRDLKPGDQINVTLADGTVFNYEVASLNYYDAATAPVKEITGPTPVESLTLITCGGNFNRSNLTYNQRLIVRATRADATASSR